MIKGRPRLKKKSKRKNLELLLFIPTLVHATRLVDSIFNLTQVVYQKETSQIYLGSPSIVRIRSTGNLLISSDRFGPGSGVEGGPRNVSIHSQISEDEWDVLCWVPGMYWSSLFQLKAASDNDVFLLGTETDGPAPLKIARSRDGGVTWLSTDAAVISGELRGNVSYETGPTAVVEFGGRIYRAIERLAPPLFRWGVDFQAVVASAPVANCSSAENISCIDALTDPASWSLSPPLPFNISWLEGFEQPPAAPGFLEGNMVMGPDGETLYNILRMDDTENQVPNFWGNRAILLRYDPPPVDQLSFDAVVDFPGGHSKFVVRRHDSGLYVTLSNPTLNPKYTDQRNELYVCVSMDLRNWTRGSSAVLFDDTGLALSRDDSVRYTGFHYVDWQFDGENDEDIVMAVRTAYRGAVSYHNSNRITSMTLKGWKGWA